MILVQFKWNKDKKVKQVKEENIITFEAPDTAIEAVTLPCSMEVV